MEFCPAAPDLIEERVGQAWEQVVHLVDAHTMAVQAWLPTRTPRADRFEGIGVTASCSGIRVRLLNLALGSDYPPDASDELICAEIEAVKGFFDERGVPWYWWIGPCPRPSDMVQRLERSGLQPDRPPLPAMVAPLPAKCAPLNPGAQVWLAQGRDDLEAASPEFGSVARKVLANSPVPVHLVNPFQQ